MILVGVWKRFSHLGFPKRGGVGDVGLTRKDGTHVNQGSDELRNRRLHEIEILNANLRRVQARPGTCDTQPSVYRTRLDALREEILGGSRFISQRKRLSE
jgi:hypothetical protein